MKITGGQPPVPGELKSGKTTGKEIEKESKEGKAGISKDDTVKTSSFILDKIKNRLNVEPDVRADRVAEFPQPGYINIRQEPAVVGSKAEHKLGAVADAVVVDVQEFLKRLEMALRVGMPEPVAPPQRRVGLHRTPAKVAVAIDNVPVVGQRVTALVAHPAEIGAHVAEHAGKGLEVAHDLPCVGPVVIDQPVNVPLLAGAAVVAVAAVREQSKASLSEVRSELRVGDPPQYSQVRSADGEAALAVQ
jgi:hypothetical protein